MNDERAHSEKDGSRQEGGSGWPDQQSLYRAARKALRQMKMILPVLGGVILLIGLFKTFVSEAWIRSIFTGHTLTDSILGSVFGSILAGNPVNSYVIGRGLLDVNVSLVGVTAFILTWVTVGIVQFPAEWAALGARFALARALTAFLVAIPLSWLVSLCIEVLS